MEPYCAKTKRRLEIKEPTGTLWGDTTVVSDIEVTVEYVEGLRKPLLVKVIQYDMSPEQFGFYRLGMFGPLVDVAQFAEKVAKEGTAYILDTASQPNKKILAKRKEELEEKFEAAVKDAVAELMVG